MSNKIGSVKSRLRGIYLVLVLAGTMSTVAALPLLAGNVLQSSTTPDPGGDFFIISSVDGPKQQIVLKKPTEVTELVRVTDTTVYLNEDGRAVSFKDLRAGDTVYVTVRSEREGLPVAIRIRKGPMTPDELHRRYLKY